MDDKRLDYLVEAAERIAGSRAPMLWLPEIYDAVYRALLVPVPVLEVLQRRVFDWASLEVRSLFPPCLVPLWSSDSGIVVGEWRHWFVKRDSVIVEHYGLTSAGAQHMTLELARDYTQLGYLMVLRELESAAEVGERQRELALALGVEDFDAVVSIWEEHGDLEAGFASHPAFRKALPQSCFDYRLDRYTGDFPWPGMALGSSALRRVSLSEIHSRFRHGSPSFEFRERVAELANAPPWLKGGDQARTFREALKFGDLGGAWLTLCSVGWRYGDARQAILDLADACDDRRFRVLALTWSALPFDEDAMY